MVPLGPWVKLAVVTSDGTVGSQAHVEVAEAGCPEAHVSAFDSIPSHSSESSLRSIFSLKFKGCGKLGHSFQFLRHRPCLEGSSQVPTIVIWGQALRETFPRVLYCAQA